MSQAKSITNLSTRVNELLKKLCAGLVVSKMDKTLIDGDIIGLLQLAELIDQKLEKSVAVCLILHNCHGQIINVGKDN